MSLTTVIGAQGFVGARVVARLAAEGADVFAPAKGDPALFERDLGQVIYCAGLTADYIQRPFDTVSAHVELVSRMARQARFERFVYLSSIRLYDSAGDDVGRETAPLSLAVDNPRSLYDLSKALGENLTLTQMGGRGTVARLANVYDAGPADPGFLSEWLARAATTRDIELDSSPAVTRDYVHADDVAEALIRMAKDGEGVINVASGQLVSNADLAACFEAGGWRIRFRRQDQLSPPPRIDIDRLRALGLAPRGVKDHVAAYLRELSNR
ncbi:NAD(P)-dependent oxidoreductase [Phenylobacterium aquaticum]|uniref:NAD-dependent epimerase/dehydratase family protein n=1 Tax=Phenylobacterium aquaticum TaxID=1763816 RepID=UPI0026ED5837|nr:SDR family oxidoreductase [Phenylobacterium aquaticum]